MNIAIQETEDSREESAAFKDGTIFLHLANHSEWALFDLLVRRASSGVSVQDRNRGAQEIEKILRRSGFMAKVS